MLISPPEFAAPPEKNLSMVNPLFANCLAMFPYIFSLPVMAI
jgi:hypothetical protein